MATDSAQVLSSLHAKLRSWCSGNGVSRREDSVSYTSQIFSGAVRKVNSVRMPVQGSVLDKDLLSAVLLRFFTVVGPLANGSRRPHSHRFQLYTHKTPTGLY